MSAPRRTFPVVAAIALAVAGTATPTAFAHKLIVTATVRPPTADGPAAVTVDAHYEHGNAVEGVVTLTGPGGAEVGRMALSSSVESVRIPVPRLTPGEYTVVVDDGAGHRSSVTFALNINEPPPDAVQSESRNRWLMIGVGLGVIAGLTVAGRKAVRGTESA